MNLNELNVIQNTIIVKIRSYINNQSKSQKENLKNCKKALNFLLKRNYKGEVNIKVE
jgi:hypothetical protein